MQFALSEISLLWGTGSFDSFQLDFLGEENKNKNKAGASTELWHNET